jgi:aspartyl-tRNA(Asn)/glutamyl-tRNA(Gln) amidotransferase subunit B
VLISNKPLADFFETCAKKYSNYKEIVNWLNNEIAGYLNEQDKEINETKMTPKLLLELIDLVEKNTISIKIAKKIIPDLLLGKNPSKLVTEQQMHKISDPIILEPLCQKIITNNPQVLEDIKKKPKAFMSLVGFVMAETKGKADSEIVQKILAEKIGFDLEKMKKE